MNQVYHCFSALLADSAERFRDDAFLCTESHTYTYQDFYDLVMYLARQIQPTACKRLVIAAREQLSFALLVFAGAVSGYTVCLLPDNMDETFLMPCRVINDDEMNRLLHDYKERQETPSAPDSKIDGEFILFSAGTTSANKGVRLKQSQILTNVSYCIQQYHYWRGERLVHILPYWHVFGLAGDLLAPMMEGACICLLQNSMAYFAAVRSFHPHALNMPPALATVYCQMLQKAANPTEITGGALQKILCAGAPLAESTHRQLCAFGIIPCVAYGLTECGTCISVTDGNASNVGSSGKVIGCMKLKIASDGEILVRGSTVMQGYYQSAEGDVVNIEDGWLHTGDLGELHEDGNLYVTGRKHNMLVFANGIKCVPERIEAQITAHSGAGECILTQNADKSLPVLIIVEGTEQLNISAVNEIMRKNQMYPFSLIKRSEPLRRNQLGKVIRNL